MILCWKNILILHGLKFAQYASEVVACDYFFVQNTFVWFWNICPQYGSEIRSCFYSFVQNIFVKLDDAISALGKKFELGGSFYLV